MKTAIPHINAHQRALAMDEAFNRHVHRITLPVDNSQSLPSATYAHPGA